MIRGLYRHPRRPRDLGALTPVLLLALLGALGCRTPRSEGPPEEPPGLEASSAGSQAPEGKDAIDPGDPSSITGMDAKASGSDTTTGEALALPEPPMDASVEGRPLFCHLFQWESEGPRDPEGTLHGPVLIIGGIHGNEPASAVLAEALIDHLSTPTDGPGGRTVIVVPAANPDGLARNTRHNANGVDVNRNFPARNRKNTARYGEGGLTEPESRFLDELIRMFDPAVIVSIHQPIACVDWDGPAEDLARAMSEASGLHLKKLGARPGSLGAYAGQDLGIPIVTIELPKRATRMTAEELWEAYGECLLVALRWRPATASAEG